MRRADRQERGSSLVEAALALPCLVLAVYWSAALTDVLLLKLKAAEAARYALWESTVFKSPALIGEDVKRRFADLASPRDVEVSHTALLLAPRARDLRWRADVDLTSAEVSLAGASRQPDRSGPWSAFAGLVSGTLPRGLDAAFRAMSFNTHGMAIVRVAVRSRPGAGSPILRGGDLPWLRPGEDPGAPRSLRDLEVAAPLSSHRPLQLVFDTWKAWPKPAAYTLHGGGTDVGTAPSRTYPEVEKQVGAQVGRIAFFGADRIPGFRTLRDFAAGLAGSGVSAAVAGGTLPDIFSAGRMDERASNRGPITILPPERAPESWVPHRCEIAGADVPCPTQRAGDVTTAEGKASFLSGDSSIGPGVDRPRYTLPYRIRTVYWKDPGGIDRELDEPRVEPPAPKLWDDNGYVRSYLCRGHFFAGSTVAQQADRWSCR